MHYQHISFAILLRRFTKPLACLLALAAAGVNASALELKSPNGQLITKFAVTDFEGLPDSLVYQVSWNGHTILSNSRLGLEVAGAPLVQNFKVTKEQSSTHDSTWQPVCGERSTVRDHYNQVVVRLEQSGRDRRVVELTFRAYDQGVAYSYTVPKQAAVKLVKIDREHSEFRFSGDHPAWAVYSAQGVYQKTSVSRIKSGCERPLTVEVKPDLYVALAEARLVDYARTKFGPLKGKANGLVTELSGPVTSNLPLTTPWRVIMVANSAGQLLENNDMILNLNDPCAIADTSWIKPGKVIREVTLTTAGGKACVDLAVKRNLEYIMFDAGWYGPESSKQSDASTVTLDPARSKGPLDLPEVIRYGNERGIGTILYVNQNALSKQLDEILPLYRKWGVKGVKYGFVAVGSQQSTTWLHAAIRKAAEHHLMLDIHDEYRPTGYQRTYPNLMTMEGIAGDETTPPNGNTLTHLFSRLLAGPADNTVCYYAPRVDKMSSHAYQLAKPVCIYSPWQFLFWYDRPAAAPAQIGGAGGSNGNIGDEPELEFWDALPTTWDETKVIHGRIGEYAVIARRKGSDWFIGAMNSTQARTLEVPLDFLSPGGKYTAAIYSDDPSMNTRTKVRIDRKSVDAKTVLSVAMSAQGGQAIHITLGR